MCLYLCTVYIYTATAWLRKEMVESRRKSCWDHSCARGQEIKFACRPRQRIYTEEGTRHNQIISALRLYKHGGFTYAYVHIVLICFCIVLVFIIDI